MTAKEPAELGRKRRYPTPESMVDGIKEYFQKCDTKNKPYTVPGLCLHLGFHSRGMLWQYEQYDDGAYCDVIGMAKLRIEVQRNESLISAEGQKVGIIFDLKNNFGWEDRNKHEHGGDGGGPVQFTTVYEGKPKG
ncbi:terminase small subunit [Thalassospira lohafexi]|uniref:Uncharacterized protein n=1 Tax=Thalassospira lohafexi TaxID=744227 RepID=A0A2N3L0L4_9PROT|nr:terminase small subunit [Thalassospira lohafexi]PKR56354.1 hypothetical protein COO92_21350 [Thalassospira lohafexi]